VTEANPVDPELAGFRVVAFQTEYRGAGSGGSTDGSADPSAAPVGGKPQIAIKMAVATSRANEGDANRFMINTIDAWLKQNAERKGVPYKILPSARNTYWQRLRVEELPKPEELKREGDAEQPGRGRERDAGGGGGKNAGGRDGPDNERFTPGDGGGGGQGLGNAPLDKLMPPRRWPGPMFTMQVDWTIEFVSPTENKPEETGT
jgi:hypothetical protein